MKFRKTICLIMACLMMLTMSACSSQSTAEKTSLNQLYCYLPSNNLVNNTAWISLDDGSYMTFTNGNAYDWYMEKDMSEDNVVRGTYEFYFGESAMNRLSTDSEDSQALIDSLEKVTDQYEDYSLDNFVFLIVDYTSSMLGGEERLSEPTTVYYVGFLISNEKQLDLINMKTGGYYQFEKE